MCNVYAQTKKKEEVKDHFHLSDNRMEQLEPQQGIYPRNTAPVIRLAPDGDKELVHLTWGVELPQKGKAPKPVTNMRDDKAQSSPFWKSSFEMRRCLVPATSFCEPKGKSPATWHWFALQDARDPRPLFAFAGVWREETYAFATTTPNELVATIHPSRMPVMLKSREAQDIWLTGNPQEAAGMLRQMPADMMHVVQSGSEREDMLGAA